MHALLLSITQYSYPGIFIALGLGILGLPIPDEMLLAFVGFLIFQGKLIYFYAIAVAFIGTSWQDIGKTIRKTIRCKDSFESRPYSKC